MDVRQFMEEAGCTMIKGSGENLISLCPFHTDHHRSFSMNTQTGKYICFSESCGEYGGLLSFLIRACDYSYKRARKVAESYGAVVERSKYESVSIDLPEWSERRRPPVPPEMEEKYLALFDFCPTYMRRDRGFERAVLKRWEVGFDFEANRVTIPVRDGAGRLIGMTKRALDDTYPKYLHLNFRKSDLLYGEHFVAMKGRRADKVWVAEGQLDAMALSQLGLTNVVSTMGARVGNGQIKRLLRWPKVVLAFDNDDDGVRATMKVGDALVAKGKRDVFVARSYPEDCNDPSDLMLRNSETEVKQFFKNQESYDTWRLDNVEAMV